MNRGADLLIQTLRRSGVDSLFALSGNQVMPVFDASVDADISLIHVRHEAAAVHIADAWGRLTGRPGVALVPAGPGFANALSALYVARMAESPLVLLSGHAPNEPVGVGAFQDMPQAEMASHVSKASWTVNTVERISEDLTRALWLSTSGRPGPVHLSIPFDVLEARSMQADAPGSLSRFGGTASEAISAEMTEQMLDMLADAERPLVLAGPSMCRGHAWNALDSFCRATGVPVVGMESPRGVNDPSLGAVAELLPDADVVLLLAKQLDFTLRANGEIAFGPACRFLQIDPEQQPLDMVQRVLGDSSRILQQVVAEPVSAIATFTEAASQRTWSGSEWCEEVRTAVAWRPAEWGDINTGRDGSAHAVEVCRGVQQFLDHDESVFISDGGEFGQWAQACLTARHRVINGPSGAIGGSIPFALAARLAFPQSRIVTTFGDGTFGFHGMEFDTAVRNQLPFIAVVGNDAAWNAEYQIQLRKYGRDRTVGCELLPTRYDQIVAAAGGHGERVTDADDVLPALLRAESSGLPACINVPIQRTAAPVIRRTS